MINLIEGNSADFQVTVTVNGAPYDLTGHKAWFTIKLNKTDPDSSASILSTTVNGGITLTNPVGGIMTISLTPEETDLLPVGTTLFADVQIRNPLGKVYTVMFDTVQVAQRVTTALDIP